ncbi:hypothetical protein ABIE85_008665 [Bradyrhizobium diazoefficiens]|jgi:hypothetical protein|uniref:hypothetical protein n=1 Tax=Bradyrhizobium TaxID=374 RepID=UPI00272A2D45|nr:hypothetical protein [Bradyrhizobium diazoefficiens]WLA58819.1 hypothetical protein QIH81_09185 [Bradyrhizobium diazoefficiens]
MAIEIEDAIVAAARSIGFAINSATMTTVAIDLAGSTIKDGVIMVPGKGGLKVEDYLQDLRARAPSGFSKVQPHEKPESERTVSEMRRGRRLDAAWHARHAKATGITKAMMDEIMRNRA